MHIDHINISAPKELLESVKEFYCAIFGLVAGRRPNFSTPGFWLYSGDNAIIHLMESSEHYSNEKQGYLDHVAYKTTGLKELVNKLNALNIEYTVNSMPEMHMSQVFFKDPAGVGVEVKFINETL